ncbi:DNA modification methylase [Polaribacter sp. HL-MS24]|jgi:DNA modification methylase|uniref:DNA modification methylase n=1 Tax=Polaribacter sp. HL-MS24 TaxID=3077735 RepID=UPI002935125E|nr:DNA methyltransferase [Polaribacter sp. HL-MS24]WOC40682.1 DNA methyltransferase [Polaribacter sp. HL-MS24]
MKNSMEQFEVVKIDQIVKVEEFKNFYESQTDDSENQLKSSLEQEGQLLPLTLSRDFQLIDGYRRLKLLCALCKTEVKVQFVDIEPSIDLRLSFNIYRVKTANDLTKEVLQVFKSVEKRQGQGNNGKSYDRYEIVKEKLNYRWKSPKAIRQFDKIIENDFENNLLLNGVVNKGWSLSDCEKYLSELKEIDLTKNHGFTAELTKGDLTIKQVNKFIEEKENLQNNYKDTFVIPNKATSFKMNCVDIVDVPSYTRSVATLFTSIPYYMLRGYDKKNLSSELGHEKTPEEFADNIGEVFGKVEGVLNETSNVFVNVGDTYDNGCAMDISGLVKAAILKHTKLKYKECIIWSKPNPHPQGEQVKRPINQIEYILWFVVDPSKSKYNLLKYTDQEKEVRITTGAKDVDKNGNVSKKTKSLSKPYKKIYNHIAAQDVDHMIKCATGKNKPAYDAFPTGHPALMSELLPVIPILMTTDETDLVYDPFGGANTTGRISLLLNRQYLGTELSTHYHRVGCKVLENTIEEINQNDLEIINSEYKEVEELTVAA